MLWENLKDSDIPHHMTIRAHIDEVLENHLKQLEEEMQVSKLSSNFIDCWLTHNLFRVL